MAALNSCTTRPFRSALKQTWSTAHQARDLSYDFLIITTGAELVWDSIPGLGPTRFTHSILHTTRR
jgi:NADH dehydrogenase FAD-containing subunit